MGTYNESNLTVLTLREFCVLSIAIITLPYFIVGFWFGYFDYSYLGLICISIGLIISVGSIFRFVSICRRRHADIH